MSQTRLLHISDTHLGRRQYGSDVRRADFMAAFEQAIEVAIDRDVDAVVHTGDLFHDSVPSLPTVTRCADVLDGLATNDIPFYGIVGNHERKNDEQWLDLLRRTDAAERLGREPTLVGDVALYGIDAVRPSVWETAEFELAEPPAEAGTTILCMHELLEPPARGKEANYPVSDVLDRVDVDLDGLALGDLHKPKSDRVDETDVWYASATERGARDQEETGLVQLLEVEDGDITRRQIELDVRPFTTFTISFGEDDGAEHARDVIARHALEGAAAIVELTGERGAVTANEVTQMVRGAGAEVVNVDDNRGRVDLDVTSIEAASLQSLEDAIEQRLADEEVTEVTLDVDDRVRGDDSLANTAGSVANDLEPVLQEAQETAFGETDDDRAEESEVAE